MKVEAATYSLAEELLLAEIRDAGGAMHAVLEFEPPLPFSEHESKFSEPELYLIGGDDRFETDEPRVTAFETDEKRERLRQEWRDSYFEKPVCRTCSQPISARNGRPLQLTQLPSKDDGAFGNFGITIQIFSEDFLSLLSSKERERLKLRPVIQNSKRRKFYELLGPADVSFVGTSFLPTSGWRCGTCRYSVWGYWIQNFRFRCFIAQRDLISPQPEIFTLGTGPDVQLCVSGDKWRAMRGKIGARGFATRPLGVAKDKDLIRHPELPIRGDRK